MAKKKLGKGLDALFADEGIDVNTLSKVEKEVSSEEIVNVEIENLRPNPYQPRSVFDEDALNDLSASIKEHGIFQPLIIKKAIKGYEIVAGERRFRAAKIAGLTEVPAVVRDFSDQQMMEIALLENLQRENLNGIEEARAYQNLISKLNITQAELAKRVGKSRAHITNTLGILKLPEDIQKLVYDNKISTAHARTLSKYDNYDEIRKIADQIVGENLSVREIEKIRSEKKVTTKDVHVKDVEEKLCQALNRKVVIEKQKLVISFSDTDDLNELIKLLIKR